MGTIDIKIEYFCRGINKESSGRAWQCNPHSIFNE
jgi:hypothetical protein